MAVRLKWSKLHLQTYDKCNKKFVKEIKNNVTEIYKYKGNQRLLFIILRTL